LPDFTLSVLAPNGFDPGGGYPYSYIKAPGGGASFQNGIIYTNSNDQSINFFQLTLTSSSIQSLNIYLEYGVSDANGLDDTSLSISADGGAAVSAPITDGASENEFAEFTVTGPPALSRWAHHPRLAVLLAAKSSMAGLSLPALGRPSTRGRVDPRGA